MLPGEIYYLILLQVEDRVLYNCLLASSSFHVMTQKDLLEKKIKYCLDKSLYRKSPYVMAIMKGWLQVCQVLYDRGYLLCRPAMEGFMYKDDLYSCCLKYNRKDIGKWLLEKGYLPSEKSLYQCIENKDMEEYKFLSENLNIGGNIIRLHYDAITYGSLDILKHVQKEINLLPHIQYALVSSVKSRSLEMVIYVWNQVCMTNNNVIKKYFTMATAHAIMMNEYEILDFLLEKNINVDLITYHDVIRRGDITMLNYLKNKNKTCPWTTISDLMILWKTKGQIITEIVSRLLVQEGCQIYGFDRVSFHDIDDDLLKVLDSANFKDNTTFYNR